MEIFFIVLGSFFIFLGLGIHVFKWYFLISGYNTMSKEKKKNVNVKALGKLMGLYMYTNGGFMILAGLLEKWGMGYGTILWVGYMLVSTGYLLIKAQKYDGNMVDQEGKWNKQGRREMLVVYILMAAIAVFVGGILFVSSRPTQVEFTSKGFSIEGMYGETFLWEELDELRLIENLPTIQRRTNGSEVGSHLKGHFRTTEFGAVKLFVQADHPPFIFLSAGEKIVIFNMENEEATRAMMKAILDEKK
jgi:hypothetical protein